MAVKIFLPKILPFCAIRYAIRLDRHVEDMDMNLGNGEMGTVVLIKV